jgi:hypothetical protein
MVPWPRSIALAYLLVGASSQQTTSRRDTSPNNRKNQDRFVSQFSSRIEAAATFHSHAKRAAEEAGIAQAYMESSGKRHIQLDYELQGLLI